MATVVRPSTTTSAATKIATTIHWNDAHDIEFVDMQQIWEEMIPELEKIKQEGKVKYIGVSGYPMKIFREAAAKSEIDVILS